MEIRDVIGSLREKHLDHQRQIDALRLAIHLIEYRLSRIDVSRETEKINGQLEIPLPAPDAPAAAQTGVGEAR